nr:MAG TPA: hypothetical protein [Crassvirales sp.]
MRGLNLRPLGYEPNKLPLLYSAILFYNYNLRDFTLKDYNC